MALEPLPFGFGDFLIDVPPFPSLWSFQDHHANQQSMEELRQSLIATSLELESAKEEVKKREASIQELVELVKATARERDDAREQLQLLRAAAALRRPYSPPAPAPPQPALVASSFADSDSLSDTRTHPSSRVSSPFDPFLDPVTSSEERHQAAAPMAAERNASPPVYGRADAVFDALAKNRPLPPKGRLLQAVMEAGPLLQNLLVAGPLPRWNNPPPLKALDAPPHAMEGQPQLGHAAVPSVPPMASYLSAQEFCMKRPAMAAAPAAANCFQSLTSAKRQRPHGLIV